MTRLAIRVKHHPNGTSTLSGIPSRFLRDVFTAASNRQYELEKQYKDRPSDPDINDPWFKIMRAIIDSVANAPRYRHGYEDVPVIQLDRLGRVCRLRAVREQRKFSIEVAEIMSMIMAGVEKRRQQRNPQ
ncbi:hypothetical protein [Bradyrhizobium sp. USDA 241]|uniref:hypothetical protein n=1 Tax=Bradyrhizobium sp. USDA 241 TaxID=3377725 RepID=UPI003C709A47